MINQNDSQLLNSSQSIEQAIEFVYNEQSLGGIFELFTPLLSHEDENIQKIMISTVLNQCNYYAKTMSKTLKLNKVPTAVYSCATGTTSSKKLNILIVDFTPHLLAFALQMIPSLDLAYQLSYKLAKTFEKSCLNHYQGRFLQHLVKPIINFLKNTLLTSMPQLVGDSDKSLYTNLILLNLFTAVSNKDKKQLGIKTSEIHFDQKTVQLILDALNSDPDTALQMIEWSIIALRVYEEAFKNNKCSYRVKYEEGIPSGVVEVIGNGSRAGGGGRVLLRPINNSANWKWHPLFINCEQQFELLDRKVPTQIMLMIDFIIRKLESVEKIEAATNGKASDLMQVIKDLSLKKPANKFLNSIGGQVIKSLLLMINKSLPDPQKEVESIMKKQLGSTYFEEFYSIYEQIFNKSLAKKGIASLSFNVQFLLHSLLQKLFKNAAQNQESWSYYILEQKPSRLPLINYLFESAFMLNDESSELCLKLAALAFDETAVFSFKSESFQISLFTIFSRALKKAEDEKVEIFELPQDAGLKIEITKLIDTMLLGRNKKQLRIASCHLLKGLYDHAPYYQTAIKEVLISRLPQLRTKGVNALEFIALLSYIVNKDIISKGLQADQKLYQRLSREIYKQVARTNQQLVAHENLDIYATLQRVTSAFQSSAFEMQVGGEEEFLKKLILDRESPSSVYGVPKYDGGRGGPGGAGIRITNPYMLETEACQKCYLQKSQPYSQYRRDDIKIEHKYTDSRMIYRFNTTYTFKQIKISQTDFRGNKAIKEIAIYANNTQGVDLADMKNNMQYWKKVKTQDVEPYIRDIIVEFTLPVNAMNLMIELITGNTSKNFGRGDRQPDRQPQRGPYEQHKKALKIESIHQVKGLDTVLMSLPKVIAQNLGIIKQDGSDTKEVMKDEDGNVIDKDKMVCPRCSRVVTGRHGICNGCGENAQQCHYCRNINYEKPDGFLCNECGNSRFSKIDVSFIAKQGFACEKIESENSKSLALKQIEDNLQTAQMAYNELMKKRQSIASQIKKLNEGYGGSDSSQQEISNMYQQQCAEQYNKMMKSLSTIKVLKVEIDQFTQSSTNQETNEEPEKLAPLQLSRSLSAISTPEDEQVQESCFSCIQEYLKGLLSFIQMTSEKLAENHKAQGFLELLYKENLNMYSAQLQDPARRTICLLVKSDQEKACNLLTKIEEDLFSKRNIIPAHLLSSNIIQETQLVLDLLKLQSQLKEKEGQPHFYDIVLESMWGIFFRALKEGYSNAAIADQVAGSFLGFIKDFIKSSQKEGNKCAKELFDQIISQFDNQKETSTINKAQIKFLNGQNFLIYCLILNSSQKVRKEAQEIINFLATSNQQGIPDIKSELLGKLISVLDKVLQLESSAGDQYFDLLTSLLSPEVIKERITEASLEPSSPNYFYVKAFDLLFKQIDSELVKLLHQESQRAKIGADGFMPQISTGQIFGRVVSLVSSMTKESAHLKSIIQNNVNIVIKTFLKVKKLNLLKNKVISNAEVEIEKMFNELHSEKEEEKANFMLHCIKIIESGDCDQQEMRFLFERISKIINPVLPEPEYLLQLTRAQSQEFYFRGKMSKNPYSSSSLGKTMADVRLKICKEMDLAEPELLELLVANKIVGMDLTIKQVYEQVHWPEICRQRDPDAYDVPNINDAPKNQIVPMQVIYRLMGIDGEATEDRVDSLQDSNEADMDPENIKKKFGFTEVLCKEFESKCQPGVQISGVKVLIDVLENFGSLQKQRYLAEWLFKVIGFVIRVKKNRVEFLKYKQTVDQLAKRLFESVGMQSQIENQKDATLFDVILVILEQVIVEVNQSQDSTSLSASLENMDIDQQHENKEAATHVEIFIQILADSCNEMVSNYQGLDKTSKKIKAVSKILPFLINKEDTSAQQIIIDFIAQALTKIPLLDNLAEMTAKEKFIAQFNLERVLEILDSTPVSKNYLKEQLGLACGQLFESMWNYLLNTTMVDLSNEAAVHKYKLANQYSLKMLYSFYKNLPSLQLKLFTSHQKLLERVYELTQSKYKDRSLILLSLDIVQSFTNKANQNDPQVSELLQKLIDSQNDEKKRLAQKKKEEIMRQMALKKTQNKFIKQIDQIDIKEEAGPKCIVCQDGYSKKTTDVLGMYVFSKKLKISEISEAGLGFTSTVGYTTVTHSSFIHFTCHQNAYRADQQLKNPKREWEGAAIRNDHTKCNNLFPIRGGQLRMDDYQSMVERYFQSQQKNIGQVDPDRIKVLLHDFKMLMKRFAYEDSFSRDTHGGGPEHNMRLVPFMIQMIHSLLTVNGSYKLPSREQSNFIYHNEKRIQQFLEQGMKMKRDFLQKLEEEKKAHEIEEEEKFSQSQDDYGDESMKGDNNANEDESQLTDLSIDQIIYMLTQCLVFCQAPRWEVYKHKFFTIILCTVANMKDDKVAEVKPSGNQTDFATGKKVITIAKTEDVQMTTTTSDLFKNLGAEEGGEARKRRVSSDNRSDLLHKALIKLRPLLVLMCLIDNIKKKWDAKRLSLLGQNEDACIKQDEYLKRLTEEFISKGNLQDVIADCDELFREYKDRILKHSSVEDFLQDMGMLEKIAAGQQLEQFILTHFQQ